MAAVETLERRIARLFLEKLHLEIPSVETDLIDTGVIDSMAFVDLLVHLEQEFGLRVNFDDVDLANFRSVKRIAEFITRRSGVKAAS